MGNLTTPQTKSKGLALFMIGYFVTNKFGALFKCMYNKILIGRKKSMKNLTNKDGEVREITKSDIKRFKKADKTIAEGMKRLRGQRGPQKSPTKIPVSLRLSSEVVEHFKKGGKGWQARINAALEKNIEDQTRH